MSLLVVEGLRMRYGPVEVLHGIDFAIAEGEVVALLGPNGAGKTSTLRALIGTRPSTGRVTLDGKPLAPASRERVIAGLSLVPEGREIFIRLTVHENIMIGAYLRSDDAQIEKDYRRMLELFPSLEKRLHQRAVVLSGGEQQMLAIARALMARPRILMLDEPSMGLAPLAVSTVFTVLQDLVSQGITLLLVEQNARLALRLAKRGYLLERGAIVMSGASHELESAAEVRGAYLGIERGA